ncbi:MAG TPA: ABC transporter permease [Solirubrobacterales bacterium]|nr:ABC transporter permease [Solirubrobacterales bacterium]
MLSAKVGTGIVAELGAMRISDEIDALEVMGVSPMIFLCGTGLLASWLVFPFIYLGGIGSCTSPATSPWSSRSPRSPPAATS